MAAGLGPPAPGAARDSERFTRPRLSFWEGNPIWVFGCGGLKDEVYPVFGKPCLGKMFEGGQEEIHFFGRHSNSKTWTRVKLHDCESATSTWWE